MTHEEYIEAKVLKTPCPDCGLIEGCHVTGCSQDVECDDTEAK